MYIDTRDRYTIIQSLKDLTGYNTYDVIEYIDTKNMEKFYSKINIDEVLLHHLSRRLIGTENLATVDLHTLLTTDNKLSNLLSKYGFKFFRNGKNVNMYFNGELIEFTDDWLWEKQGTGGNAARLRIRLNYCEIRKHADKCVNGYGIGEIKNDCRYGKLTQGGEFLQDLWGVFELPDLQREYYNNSKFYVMTFILPIDKCKWDIVGEIDFKKRLLQYIFDYYETDKVSSPYILTDNNITIPSENLISCKIVDWNKNT